MSSDFVLRWRYIDIEIITLAAKITSTTNYHCGHLKLNHRKNMVHEIAKGWNKNNDPKTLHRDS